MVFGLFENGSEAFEEVIWSILPKNRTTYNSLRHILFFLVYSPIFEVQNNSVT